MAPTTKKNFSVNKQTTASASRRISATLAAGRPGQHRRRAAFPWPDRDAHRCHRAGDCATIPSGHQRIWMKVPRL
jgi:hypothetical protein